MKRRVLAATMFGLTSVLGCAGMDQGVMGDIVRQSGGAAVSDAVGQVDPRLAHAARPAAMIAFNSAITALLSRDDQLAVSQQSANALENGRDGEAFDWTNPQTGAKAKIVPGERRQTTKQVVIVRDKTVTAPPPLVLLGQPYRSRGVANLRASPSAESAKVGSLQGGEEFTAVGRTDGAPWLLVGQRGRSVGYVREDLAQPGPGQVSAGTLRPAINLDEIELGDDVVAESVSAKTQCRGVKIVVENKSGKSAKEERQACRSGEGGWEA